MIIGVIGDRRMIKIIYDVHSHQKWAFGETKDVERRVFYGKDEFDIMKQQDEIIHIWYQDPAVKSIRFEEISRENLEEEDDRL